MTPKEKAAELFVKFCQYTPADPEFEEEYTKKCVLICVEEVISSIPAHNKDWVYWHQVKKEILTS